MDIRQIVHRTYVVQCNRGVLIVAADKQSHLKLLLEDIRGALGEEPEKPPALDGKGENEQEAQSAAGNVLGDSPGFERGQCPCIRKNYGKLQSDVENCQRAPIGIVPEHGSSPHKFQVSNPRQEYYRSHNLAAFKRPTSFAASHDIHQE